MIICMHFFGKYKFNDIKSRNANEVINPSQTFNMQLTQCNLFVTCKSCKGRNINELKYFSAVAHQ